MDGSSDSMAKKPLIISRYVGGTPRELAKKLGGLVAMADPQAAKFSPFIINWGSSLAIRCKPNSKVLNKPLAVAWSSDKLLTFQKVAGHAKTVDWTVEPEKAVQWLLDGSSVVCRKVTRGSAGEGIEIVKWEDFKKAGKRPIDLPKCPLYTRYFPKSQEVRVHVAGNEVIHYAAKLRRREGIDEPADPWIRTHDRGWVFATQGVVPNKEAEQIAITALGRLGLDFGAVDIAIGKLGVALLEVNSAPGLEGATLDKYVKYFSKEMRANG